MIAATHTGIRCLSNGPKSIVQVAVFCGFRGCVAEGISEWAHFALWMTLDPPGILRGVHGLAGAAAHYLALAPRAVHKIGFGFRVTDDRSR
jgi:hypothetical protein